MSEIQSGDFPEFCIPSQKVWNDIAEWWDDQIGEGNAFQDLLIEPATERLLKLKPGELVLDVACGAGRFARRMAALGARVIGIDQAEKFIERAKLKAGKNGDRLDFRVCDAADSESLLSLSQQKFDAVVCTMALMDMASIEPLISSLPKLLKPTGRFVFSLTHPAFNSGSSRMLAEQYTENGQLKTRFSVSISDYIKPFHFEGIGVLGQPVSQHYFHRPLSLIFNTCFSYGLVIDGVEEPTFNQDSEIKSKLVISWASLPNVPPILVARARLSSK